jgi:CRISPR-associated endonuclease/helicase Cas3
LEPAERLKARIVTIKNSWEPDKFLASVREQLNNLEISGLASVSLDKQGNICRKTIKIKQYQIIGFTTEIAGLSDRDSLKLQQWGIGGKRHMGCGFFGAF